MNAWKRLLLSLLTAGVAGFAAHAYGADAYTITLKPPPSKTFTSKGAAGSLSFTIQNLTAQPLDVSVAATSDREWIVVTEGYGNKLYPAVKAGATVTGTVKYKVVANPAASQRDGTLTIGGQAFTIQQSAAPCTLSIAPASRSVAANGVEEASLSVTATPGCGWRARIDPATTWLSLIDEDGDGIGNGTVTYAVDLNDSFKPRNGKLYVETLAPQKLLKKTHTVTQPANTMGDLVGTYVAVVVGEEDTTLVRFDVSSKGTVGGSLKNNKGQNWPVVGTMTPSGVLNATCDGSDGRITFSGALDPDGDLAVQASWIDNGTPHTMPLTLDKAVRTSTPARFSWADTAQIDDIAGVFQLGSDGRVTGTAVTVHSTTFSFDAVLTAKDEIVGIANVISKPATADGFDSPAVLWGDYVGAPASFIMHVGVYDQGEGQGPGENAVNEMTLAVTTQALVGAYGGSFSGNSAGSWKFGVNADGGIRGYGLGNGDNTASPLLGNVNFATGALHLAIYNRNDSDEWTQIGTIDGSIGSDGKVTATWSAEGGHGTVSGARLK